MPSRICTLLALAVAAPLAGAGPSWAESPTALRSKLAREMRNAGPASGAVVRDLDSGQDLYALRPDVARVPASVEKLYTTSAALLRLGPSTTLDTVAAANALPGPDGVLRGDLHLVGGGDPFFGVNSAKLLVARLQSAGVRRIEGGVVGDETLLDTRRSGVGRGYDSDLGGVLSGLAYDRGIFAGRAQTDADGFAARRFSALLKAAGVQQGRAGRSGASSSGMVPVATTPSLPVRELIRFINVPSNNFAAEMLLKDLGARRGGAGTTAAGAAVVRSTLAGFGVRPTIADGSGLSRGDRTSPRQVVSLLEHLDGASAGPAFRASLASAGQTGTLKRRMRGTAAAGRCRLKTGTLRNVSSVAGYCRTPGGRDIAFALLMNRVRPAAAHGPQDRIAAAIAGLDGVPAAKPEAEPANPGAGAQP